MSDMLQITSPVAPKNYNLTTKPIVQNDQVFDLVDLSKVVKTSDRTEQYKQENSTFAESNGLIPKLAMMVSKDPSLAAASMKAILGNDILSQLSESGNTELLEKLNAFASEVILSPENIVSDIMSQKDKLTMFNGQFFDLLRQINSQTINNDVKNAVQALLKSIVNSSGGEEILDSVSANLKYLSEQLSASQKLSQNLDLMSKLFAQPDAKNNFAALKGQTLGLLNDVGNSLLLTDKLKSLIPLVTYNLSRYNPNPSALKESFSNLMSLLSNGELKSALTKTFEEFVSSSMPDDIKSALLKDSAVDAMKTLAEELAKQAALSSKGVDIESLKTSLSGLSKDGDTESLKNILMQILPGSSGNDVSKLLSGFLQDKNLNSLLDKLSLILNSVEDMDVKIPLAQSLNEVLSNLSKSEGISYNPPNSMESLVSFLSKNINDNALKSIQGFGQPEMLAGLLTAPGVFTPLLHYLVPLEYENTRAFGELWADNDYTDGDSDGQHLFLSFNVENIGDFELEVLAKNSEVSVSLLCPPDLADSFSKMKGNISRLAAGCGYSPKNMIIGQLAEKRMLTDVFPKIKEKRVGINVKV